MYCFGQLSLANENINGFRSFALSCSSICPAAIPFVASCLIIKGTPDLLTIQYGTYDNNTKDFII